MAVIAKQSAALAAAHNDHPSLRRGIRMATEYLAATPAFRSSRIDEARFLEDAQKLAEPP